MNLVNLPHTTGNITPARYISNAAQGVRGLTKNFAITSAGDSGAINAWRGNDGLWHAHLCRWGSTVDEWSNSTKDGLLEWLTTALESIA